jgi:glycosyltransferase involved in cell wall biosynthesis
MIRNQLNWLSFREADRMVVGLKVERRVLQTVFGLSGDRIAVVPLGLDDDFLNAGPPSRVEPHLITTGTITDRKRSLELAHMAREAQVPVLFVGKPYNRDSRYWKQFAGLIDNRFVLHREHVSDRAEMISLLKASRGFVIYSQHENWCLSAHEAVACGLPLLVPDQPWSRERFGDQARYLVPGGTGENPTRLREFYEKCPELSAPAIKLRSWDEAAKQLEVLYRSLILA